MKRPTHHTPRVRMQPFTRDLMRALTFYLVMAFALQCLWALPQGLQAVRHTHASTGSSLLSMQALVAQRAAQFQSTTHAHGDELHQHDHSSADMVVLGESGDASSPASGLALWASVWPASQLSAPVAGRETFAAAPSVAFSSRSTRVPLQPPQRG